MVMIKAIKVDKETEEVIRKFVRFCYDNNIDTAEDIGELAAAIEDKYCETLANHQTINIIYE